MTFALWTMSNTHKDIVNSHTFEEIKNTYVNSVCGENNPRYGISPTLKNIIALKTANTGRKKTAEEIEKHRIALIGRKHSEETRKKISEALKGRVFSEEHRKHIGETSKGRHWKLTEENKKNMSEAQRGTRKGWHFYNNGEINKFSKECPGEGWVLGRINETSKAV